MSNIQLPVSMLSFEQCYDLEDRGRFEALEGVIPYALSLYIDCYFQYYIGKAWLHVGAPTVYIKQFISGLRLSGGSLYDGLQCS